MCGIFGASGKVDSRILTTLGVLNAPRGEDSSGIGWVGADGGPIIEKVAETPFVAFPLTLQNGIRQAALSGVVIGHTRQATTGKITNENAHPFLMAGVAFVHNGMVSNWDKFVPEGEKYEVDSQSLIHGIKGRDFSKYEGSVALLWIEKGKLHAFRFGNPIWRGRINGTIYFSSQAHVLAAVGAVRIRELTQGHHYVFSEGQTVSVKKIPANKPWSAHHPIVHYGTERGNFKQTFRTSGDLMAEQMEEWGRIGFKPEGSIAPEHTPSQIIDAEFVQNRITEAEDTYDRRWRESWE